MVAILGRAVAARHFLVLIYFICMKISHRPIIYIIDEGSRSALQSLKQNFPWYAHSPVTSSPSAALSSLALFLSPFVCPPIGVLFHPSAAPFHPTPAFWSPIISSFHKSKLTSLLPSISPSFLQLSRPTPITWSRNMWPERWEPAGPFLQCHHTLICLLQVHIDFVLNKGKIQEK